MIDPFGEQIYEDVLMSETIMLSRMTRGQKEQLVEKKCRRYIRTIYQIVALYYMGLIFLMFLTYCIATGQRVLVGCLIWLMIGLFVTVSSSIQVKSVKKEFHKLLETEILYICVRNMRFDKVLKFSDDEGNVYENEFSSKEFEKYLNEENVCIWYTPEQGKWDVEKGFTN